MAKSNELTSRDVIWLKTIKAITQQGRFKKGDADIKTSRKNTATRLMKVMEEWGWLQRTKPNGKIWYAGPKSLERLKMTEEAQEKIEENISNLLTNGEYIRFGTEIKDKGYQSTKNDLCWDRALVLLSENGRIKTKEIADSHENIGRRMEWKALSSLEKVGLVMKERKRSKYWELGPKAEALIKFQTEEAERRAIESRKKTA